MIKAGRLNEKKLPIWELIFIAILFALYLLPSFSLGATVVLFLLFAYCAYLSVTDSEIFNLIIKVMVLIFALAFFYALLTDASSISQNASNREIKRFISKVYQYLSLYFPMILLFRVTKSASRWQKIFFVSLGAGMILYVVATTWSFLLENPDATRHWEEFGETASKDIANYYFIYAIPIVVAVVSLMMSKSGVAVKVASATAIVLGVIFLVNAQYTLSILITVAGVLIQLFRNLRTMTAKVFYVGALALIAVFFIPIFEYVMEHVGSEQVAVRLEEIYDFLTGKGTGGYNLNGRLTLYLDTVKAFFSSPIWGNRYLDFDGHATFLTVLSDTGILGGAPFYLLLYLAVKQVRALLGENKIRFTTVVIMFVMMGVTNPIHASMPLGFVTWLLAPLTILTVFKEKNNETSVEN